MPLPEGGASNGAGDLQAVHASVVGASVLALGNMVPMFTGDDKGIRAKDFLRTLEQVGAMGGWNDVQLIGIARCKMVGEAYDFAWRDRDLANAKTYAEFKTLVLAQYDTDTRSSKMERFMKAKQLDGEGVRSFASRLRALGYDTLDNFSGEGSEQKNSVARELLDGQLLTRYLTGLQDPIRRFVLSRDPSSFREAIEVAAKEERNEKMTVEQLPVRPVVTNSEQTEDMKHRLERLERMLAELTTEMRQDRQTGPRQQTSRERRCFNCGNFGHFARECQDRPRNWISRRQQSGDGPDRTRQPSPQTRHVSGTSPGN
ncbi:uncharacterized protein LOC135385048 [Ornithodoros turicata]|uniref:uncharacterized protein LOC135385048 n=1 Tax=Ornithodoros turicata TaxID=34597 RepID=UPI003139BEF7